ncbi:unnamed protein product, partial [Brassica napus]
MMLPVYPSPSISYSESSWKHNKKFAKELSIEEEDHQLRSWFLHRRCSCALLRYMHGKNGAYTSLVALDSISGNVTSFFFNIFCWFFFCE